MHAAIQTMHLSKTFGEKTAVKDLTLTVERGEVFGFLGPNGAGKTTSVKMLLNLITPSSGEGFILGEPLTNPMVRQKVGFLPEHFRFHDWLKGEEFLKLHAELYHLPKEVARRRVPELLERVGLSQHAQKKLRNFSKGMLQRIGLAQALLNEPALVILDEPTSGLDPVGRRMVRDIIAELRQKGTTVFLNSHLLSEVEITCDRVAFIKQGEVVHISSLKSMLEGELRIEMRIKNLDAEVLGGLARWSKNVHLEGERLTLDARQEEDLPEINKYLVERGAKVYSLQVKHISLEDLFIQIVGSEGEV